jgi:WD40 repeat protein
VVQRVAIDHAQRLLLATGEGRSALWRLSAPGPHAAPAQRLGLAPARHGVAARYPIDWAPATGLVATAGFDGQLRLWRLPQPVMLQARTAPQVPDQFSVDTNAVIDVAWDQLRLLPLDGRPPGRWLQLPQPPGFAELVDGGRRIALTLGAKLEFYDARSLLAAGPALDLPATPEHFATDAAGRTIALVFGESGLDGFQERLRLFDARSGKPLSGEARMAGPVRRLQFSPDGTRLLAVGPAEGSTQVFAVEALKQLGDYPHDSYQPVVWADFDPTGRELRMVTRALDARMGGNALVTWNIAEDKDSTLPLPASSLPLGVISLGKDRSFVVGTEGEWFVAAGKIGEPLPRADEGDATSALARSADGSLVAHASGRHVQLFDVATGKALGLPLRGDGDALDFVARLAFAPDGRSLVGRSLHGRWLRWPIAPEARPTAALEADLASLASAREDQHVLLMPARTQRAAWRAGDPGPTPAIQLRPGFREQSRTAGGGAIPARIAGTDAAMLDLGPVYDIAPEDVRSVFYNVRPTLRPLPVGVQRIGGQWFDIRGMAQIGFTDPALLTHTVQLDCFPLDDRPLAALHPLLLFSMPHAAPTGTVLADVTLHFKDGGTGSLPITAGRDVRGYSGGDQQVPLAFAGDIALSLLGLQDDVFSAPRLVNPEPNRPVHCIDLRTRHRQFPMLLLAATLEAPAAAPATAAGATP